MWHRLKPVEETKKKDGWRSMASTEGSSIQSVGSPARESDEEEEVGIV